MKERNPLSDDFQSMPRVLYIDLATRYGGITTRGLAIMSKLPPGKVALAGLEGSPITSRAKECGIPVHIVASSKTDPRIATRLRTIIQNEEIDVINTQNIQSKFWGSIAAALTGVPLVSWIGSWYITEYSSSNRLKAIGYQLIERITDAVTKLYIVVSDEIYNGLLSFGIPEDKLVLILNAVSVEPDDVEDRRSFLQTTYNLPDNAVIGCAIGRLVESKGHTYLVQAMKDVVSKHENAYVLVMGTGHLLPALEAEVAAAGLGNHVQFIGFLDHTDLLSVVKSSDFFVMPSLHEGTSNAMLEAAALGLPIIATSVGGNESIINNGENGLIVEPKDVAALAEAMNAVIGDPSYAQSLGQKAQARIQAEFGRAKQVAAAVEAWSKAWHKSKKR